MSRDTKGFCYWHCSAWVSAQSRILTTQQIKLIAISPRNGFSGLARRRIGRFLRLAIGRQRIKISQWERRHLRRTIGMRSP